MASRRLTTVHGAVHEGPGTTRSRRGAIAPKDTVGELARGPDGEVTVDPYEVLGLSPDATEAEVREAYRTLVRRHHPDRHAGEPPEVKAAEAARMAEVTGAFQLLHDPAALARWKANQARVGRAPGAAHPEEATATRPRATPTATSSRTPSDGGFDYRRAAASEFDDATTGRWSRTPPTPPLASSPGRPTGARRTGRTLNSRWLNRVAWVLLVGLVVALWVLGTDVGRNAWESLGRAAAVDIADPVPAASGDTPDMT